MSKVYSFPASVGAKPEPTVEIEISFRAPQTGRPYPCWDDLIWREVPAPSAADLARKRYQCEPLDSIADVNVGDVMPDGSLVVTVDRENGWYETSSEEGFAQPELGALVHGSRTAGKGKLLRDARQDWKRQQRGYCRHCDEAPCLQTEDCPGGRHFERRRAVERHQLGEKT